MSGTRNQGDEKIWTSSSDRRFGVNMLLANAPESESAKTASHRSPTAKQLWAQICQQTAEAGLSLAKRLMGRFKV